MQTLILQLCLGTARGSAFLTSSQETAIDAAGAETVLWGTKICGVFQPSYSGVGQECQQKHSSYSSGKRLKGNAETHIQT